jgi:hypothetical protein
VPHLSLLPVLRQLNVACRHLGNNLLRDARLCLFRGNSLRVPFGSCNKQSAYHQLAHQVSTCLQSLLCLCEQTPGLARPIPGNARCGTAPAGVIAGVHYLERNSSVQALWLTRKYREIWDGHVGFRSTSNHGLEVRVRMKGQL